MPPKSDAYIDCRQTKCPLNFVKTRLALEKLPINGILEVWIDQDAQSAINIPNSIQAEGHCVLAQLPHASEPETLCLWIQRLK